MKRYQFTHKCGGCGSTYYALHEVDDPEEAVFWNECPHCHKENNECVWYEEYKE